MGGGFVLGFGVTLGFGPVSGGHAVEYGAVGRGLIVRFGATLGFKLPGGGFVVGLVAALGFTPIIAAAFVAAKATGVISLCTTTIALSTCVILNPVNPPLLNPPGHQNPLPSLIHLLAPNTPYNPPTNSQPPPSNSYPYRSCSPDSLPRAQ